MKSFRPSLAYRNPLRDRFDDAFFSDLPANPGVYFMKGKDGRVLYVGKAKQLRSRLLSYRNARPGQVGDNIIELLERIRSIDWELCADERRAHERELELIHALTPTYNLAACWEEDYLSIGIRRLAPDRWEFRLTSDEVERHEGDFEYFGCYPHRRKTKSAYLALLRLLHAASVKKPRFSFPSRIARFSPPYEYVHRGEMPEAVHAGMRAFFGGQSPRLLPLLLELILENDSVPAFMRPGIQEDFDLLRDFYAHTVRTPRKKGRSGRPVLSHPELRRRLRESVEKNGELRAADGATARKSAG